MASKKQYWLMKTEPGTYSIDDLKKEKTDHWDGIRNYQARNFMRDDMTKGDEILIYHSNCDEIGVVGTAKVAKEAYPDHTAFDKKSKYFDPKSDPENPRWVMVDVSFVSKFKNPISLADMKADPDLEGMLVTKKGQRLSIQPVEEAHFKRVKKMGSAK